MRLYWPTMCVGSDSVDGVKAKLEDRGFAVFVLDGTSVTDWTTFYHAVASVLPADPPLGTYAVWDAFIDSVAEGLDQANKPNAALVWLNADSILEAGLQDLFQIIEVFQDIAWRVRYTEKKHLQNFSFAVILSGNGKNFANRKATWNGWNFVVSNSRAESGGDH